jgi:MFS family permease
MDTDAGARGRAMRFIVMLGVVSLFADVTYEGARSITGPFLGLLGASAVVVGAVAGAGELIGHALRLASGYFTDRSRKYWAIVMLGYTVNLLAVPLLALAGRWEVAALLMITERLGKAIRAPARDVMLAHAAKAVGTGWGFGLHEAMDQIGALTGPLIVALTLATYHSYRASFAVLAVPAVAALAVLMVARSRYPNPRSLDEAHAQDTGTHIPRAFWIYVAASGCIAAGYVDFPLAAFHWKQAGIASDVWIPLLYAIAMGVDAVAALVFGSLFDRWGKGVLLGAPLFASMAVPLMFTGGFRSALVGVALWGVGMGAQESVLRAAVADMVPVARRGLSYGIFNATFGVCWFAGSALMGILYQASPLRLVVFSVCAQLASVPLLVLTSRFARK